MLFDAGEAFKFFNSNLFIKISVLLKFISTNYNKCISYILRNASATRYSISSSPLDKLFEVAFRRRDVPAFSSRFVFDTRSEALKAGAIARSKLAM